MITVARKRTERSNNTPFMDVATLIFQEETPSKNGYAQIMETAREVFCSVADGVNRADFYEAQKLGVQLSATFEIWADDFGGESLLEYTGKRYRIYRTYQTGRGTLELFAAEVIK